MNPRAAAGHKDSICLPQKNLSGDKKDLADFDPALKFEDFEKPLYNGKLAAPKFDKSDYKNDKEYVKFIIEGCQKNKINFGGHYTIIEKSCGAMCQLIFLVDRIDGRIIEHCSLNENRINRNDGSISDGRFGYLYQPGSLMLMTNTGTFTDSSMTQYRRDLGTPEIYIWTDQGFMQLK